MENIIEKINDYALEDIIGERFGRYSKYIIQDRAIPDVRDGLKPVQRRILYAMYKMNNTFEKPYRKSANAVGETMGKYHPHGDSSIYEAMVRMSQDWKNNLTLIDMKGNNGSMDGDSAAAYRYTETRISKISGEFLKDLDKNTVSWTPNYDDKLLEPTVLPAKFPNLLVNGATGISAGYATNIPPHNLNEIIDGTIELIKRPNTTLDKIMEIIKGPDLPTKGIIEGIDGIKSAYKTGRGKIIIKSKFSVEKNKSLNQIVITEIPYDVNKANLVLKIAEIIINKKIEGMTEVRDETDKTGLRIVIDLKKDADTNLITNYLLKNTDLQVSYNFNMVAIVNRRPKLLGLIDILTSYIEYQKEVITKRTEFDLKHALDKSHIIEGLIKAISILDEVIHTIRISKNRSDAEKNLVEKYGFTSRQAEKIVELQLYRLTNTDIVQLNEEMNKLKIIIQALEDILKDENKMKKVMIEELNKIKNEYGIDRQTEIKDEITEIKIDTTDLISKEDCIVVVTNEGYVKRVSIRSYNSNNEETSLKEKDFVIGKYSMNTLDTVLIFTNLGNYIYLPVHELPDLKWKELGKHISNIIPLDSDEVVIASMPVYDFQENKIITTFTKKGMVKRSNLSEFKVQRYSKPMTCMKLKNNDQLISVTSDSGQEIIVTTKNGYMLKYDVSEAPITGIKTSGVKAVSLKNDELVSGLITNNKEYIAIITEKGTGKRIKLSEIEVGVRARKGNLIIRNVKTNPYYIINSCLVNSKDNIIILGKDLNIIKVSDLPITDKLSTGSSLVKDNLITSKIYQNLINPTDAEKIEPKEEIEELDLNSIDNRILTIGDFLDDFDE